MAGLMAGRKVVHLVVQMAGYWVDSKAVQKVYLLAEQTDVRKVAQKAVHLAC